MKVFVFCSDLIEFIEDERLPVWRGVILALLLFTASELSSLFLNHHYYLMYRAGTRIQSVLTAAVYNKVHTYLPFNNSYFLQTLKLSPSARREKSAGEIVNLMAIDIDRFQQMTPQIQQYWSSPLQVSARI